ncbi:hypothetical protein [Sinorhizobium americanum]|uniref:Uncharacterized protein n=1 Tax=Sinorhizobium americanum TaxID=194963 RepID=A0A1L3LVN9_9HYPH|nr:hypothetical protein [Sinorhizobium americanum]APG94093.1 hypothetical protein SAMCFNEI73_pC0371 [Sinorhizobium americanum]OAP41849.1 hypothetical protein ATC00_05525 [Sinorhizobium americanum]
MRAVFLLALSLLCVASEPLAAAQTYELLFRSTALKDLEAATGETTIVYERVVSGADTVEVGGSDSIDLKIISSGNVAMTLHRGGRSRGLGDYPASVGNPLIMYFLESVLADIANQSGGSPYYLRNRIKEALLRDAQIMRVSLRHQNADIRARVVTIRPFRNDKARERMGRFSELALTVTVSEDIPGWYYSLAATVPAASGGNEAGYSNAITFKATGEKP